MGLYFDANIEEIAKDTGLSPKTIKRHLKLLRKEGIIRRVRQGGKGHGNDVYELPEYMEDWEHFMKPLGNDPRTNRKPSGNRKGL